jgi:quercetin dioxygenase-like cupin family protein
MAWFRWLVLVTALAAGTSMAHEARVGYVLKPDEGEKAALPGVIIKASPSSGTQGGVAILQPMQPGSSTGLHYHVRADEFFYIIAGRGKATIGAVVHEIEAGDFIFVPAGQDHEIEAINALEVIEFLDAPGLDADFRHVFPTPHGGPQTLDALNDISIKNGTVYKRFP